MVDHLKAVNDYEMSHRDGESSFEADLNMLLDGLDIPFDTDGMSDFEVVKELVNRLNKEG